MGRAVWLYSIVFCRLCRITSKLRKTKLDDLHIVDDYPPSKFGITVIRLKNAARKIYFLIFLNQNSTSSLCNCIPHGIGRFGCRKEWKRGSLLIVIYDGQTILSSCLLYNYTDVFMHINHACACSSKRNHSHWALCLFIVLAYSAKLITGKNHQQISKYSR